MKSDTEAKIIWDNLKEKRDFIPLKIFQVIDKILEHFPEAVFGGSVALIIAGLLQREISDIDVFFPYKENFCRNGIFSIGENIGFSFSDTIDSFNGQKVVRMGIKIDGVEVCCFKVPDEMLVYEKVSFLGRNINIQDVKFAIMAKIAYIDKNPKHKKDLDEIIDHLCWVYNRVR